MKNSTKKNFKIGVTVLMIAVVCFCACSFALSKTSLSSRLGIYRSGEGGSENSSKVNVDINGNAKIIEDNLIINPGDTLSKTFYIKNNDSENIYYGFSEVGGNLKDFLTVKLVSGDEVLYEGKASELENFNSDKSHVINPSETKNFEMILVYPVSAGNNSGNSEFSFRVTCDYLVARGNS